MIATEAWLPAPVRVYLERRPEALLLAVDQLRVTESPRYRPWQGRTWCNVFSWDATRALGCEIPHWVLTDGTPALPFSPGSRELSANLTHEWLHQHGEKHGWRILATYDLAAMRADLGYPAVAIWKHPTGGHGHIALLIPGDRIVQAGSKNGTMTLAAGFGDKTPEFWTHD